jgi:hypothetical protein
VLPVPDTHLNISVGQVSDKDSAELPLWDEKYSSDIGNYLIVSFEGE